MSEIEQPTCRTCLKPKEPLVEEGGLLFCQDCLKNYKEIMRWMKGGEAHTASYEQFMAEYEVPYQPERDPQRGFRLPYIEPEDRNPAWSDEALTAKGLELDVKSVSRMYLLPE